MMAILNAGLVLVCALAAIPSLVLFVEAAAALAGRRVRPQVRSMDHGPVAVLVPAHNEAAGLGATLANIARQLRDKDYILVVADNCSDDTAAVAAANGAWAVTRQDAERKGKGYALDFGLRALRSRAPDVVVVIDADCRLTEGSLQILAADCAAAGRPVQSLDLMKAPAGEEARFAVAGFAWIVRNQVRPLGLSRLGLPCQLMGTGMAFPWAVIDTVDFASGNVVEDLELGVKLGRAGTPPRFCPEACVTSEFPVAEEGVIRQRQRWEQGSLAILLGSGLRTLAQALRSRNGALLAMGLDMMVPPLTLHAAIVLLLILLTAMGNVLGAVSILALAIALCSGVFFAMAMLISWSAFGRAVLPVGLWPGLFRFALAKLKIYRGFRVKGVREWVRSDRGGAE